MEEVLENSGFGFNYSNFKILNKTTDNGTKSIKCNQCDYASSRTGDLRNHLKTHSGEKSNKCHQYEYASSQAGDLRKHLKMHCREK